MTETEAVLFDAYGTVLDVGNVPPGHNQTRRPAIEYALRHYHIGRRVQRLLSEEFEVRIPRR